MKIVVKSVKNFGRQEYVPLCQRSKLLAKMCRKKHITKDQCDLLREMGFLIEEFDYVEE